MTIQADDIRHLCWDAAKLRAFVREHGKSEMTVAEVLDRVDYSDAMFAVLRPSVIPEQILRDFAARVASYELPRLPFPPEVYSEALDASLSNEAHRLVLSSRATHDLYRSTIRGPLDTPELRRSMKCLRCLCSAEAGEAALGVVSYSAEPEPWIAGLLKEMTS